LKAVTVGSLSFAKTITLALDPVIAVMESSVATGGAAKALPAEKSIKTSPATTASRS
jgi:hypothetical protein